MRTAGATRPIDVAVNDCHTARFRFYRHDHRGTLLHDVTYPPFFAGAAGSGHSWFWEHYVDQKNLWYHLRPLADLVADVDLAQENFRSVDLSTDAAWILALAGTKHVLLWARNKGDRWDHLYRDGKPLHPVSDTTLDLTPIDVTAAAAALIPAWPDDLVEDETRTVSDGQLQMPQFRYGCLVKIRR